MSTPNRLDNGHSPPQTPPHNGRALDAMPAGRRSEREFRRGDVYTRPVIDGRPVPDTPWRRLVGALRGTFTSQAAHEEAELEGQLRLRPTVTRTNTIAMLSPKGGVGKTAWTFLAGNLLASHLRLRVVAIDANPDFGTLGALAPDEMGSSRDLADVIGEMESITSAAELYPYVSPLPSGLHVLAAPAHAEVMACMTPELYGRLVAFLSRFYDVVLLDLGTGITGPIAQFALQRADQTLVVTTPEWVTANLVLRALRYLSAEAITQRLTLVLNKVPATDNGQSAAVQSAFRHQNIARRVNVPEDQQLRTMLDSGTYSLDALSRSTRMAIKQVGVHIGEQLV